MDGIFTEKDYYAPHFLPKDYLETYYNFGDEKDEFFSEKSPPGLCFGCWLRKEPGTFNWSPVVKYACELEGDRYRGPVWGAAGEGRRQNQRGKVGMG